jgi:hypothetical protein
MLVGQLQRVARRCKKCARAPGTTRCAPATRAAMLEQLPARALHQPFGCATYLSQGPGGDSVYVDWMMQNMVCCTHAGTHMWDRM